MLRPPLTVSRQFFEGTETSLNRRLRGFRRYDPDCRFEFHKRSQLFIGLHNETLSVAAMSVNNPDCSPAGING